jgi:hypothetical protein
MTQQQAAGCFFLSCHLCNSHLQLQELTVTVLLQSFKAVWPMLLAAVMSNHVTSEMTATTIDNVIEVENILRGFQSLQVLISLENVLLKSSQFQTKQKSSQQAGTPGTMKGDKPLHFLTEMCEVHKLNKTGTKETQAKQLVEHYFKHPSPCQLL